MSEAYKAGDEVDNMPAARKVFGVTELRENILLCCDFADVLRCMRINKVFKNTITGSQALRQKLHLEHDPNSSGAIHPCLPTHIHSVREKPRDGSDDLLDITGEIDVSEHFSREAQGSWRNMIVYQSPRPIRIAAVTPECTSQWWEQSTTGQLVTLGDLADAAWRREDAHEEACNQGNSMWRCKAPPFTHTYTFMLVSGCTTTQESHIFKIRLMRGVNRQLYYWTRTGNAEAAHRVLNGLESDEFYRKLQDEGVATTEDGDTLEDEWP